MENSFTGNTNLLIKHQVASSEIPGANVHTANSTRNEEAEASSNNLISSLDQSNILKQNEAVALTSNSGISKERIAEEDTSAFDTYRASQKTLSWNFSSLLSNVKTYKSVLSGKSNQVFLKKAVEKLEDVILNRNILAKAPYGIAPKPDTYSYVDASGKTITKPMIKTGSPNDYISLATYWWPDPNSSTGLPYVVSDGKTNPESNAIPDQSLLREICDDIQLLGLAYFFTKNESYAKQAIILLRAFFLDPATCINSHFKYAQVVQGLNGSYGRCTGFVDAEALPELIDGYQLLQGSVAFGEDSTIDSGMKAWFRNLWEWLTTDYTTAPAEGSEAYYHYLMMREVKDAKNNIRSAYELQVLSYAQFIGEDAWVEQEINKVIKDTDAEKGLISHQILPEAGMVSIKNKAGELVDHTVPAGTMPGEIKRTKPATYCQKNLDLLLRLGSLASNAGVDIWNYESPGGSSLKKAIQAMLYFTTQPKYWPVPEYEDITQPNTFRIYRHSMRRASGAWTDDTELQNTIQKYLSQLDEKVGQDSAYSENSYRKGLDWQILVQKLGYTF